MGRKVLSCCSPDEQQLTEDRTTNRQQCKEAVRNRKRYDMHVGSTVDGTRLAVEGMHRISNSSRIRTAVIRMTPGHRSRRTRKPLGPRLGHEPGAASGCRLQSDGRTLTEGLSCLDSGQAQSSVRFSMKWNERLSAFMLTHAVYVCSFLRWIARESK